VCVFGGSIIDLSLIQIYNNKNPWIPCGVLERGCPDITPAHEADAPTRPAAATTRESTTAVAAREKPTYKTHRPFQKNSARVVLSHCVVGSGGRPEPSAYREGTLFKRSLLGDPPAFLNDPAGGVDVQLQQVHDPLVLLGPFHELSQGNLA